MLRPEVQVDPILTASSSTLKIPEPHFDLCRGSAASRTLNISRNLRSRHARPCTAEGGTWPQNAAARFVSRSGKSKLSILTTPSFQPVAML